MAATDPKRSAKEFLYRSKNHSILEKLYSEPADFKMRIYQSITFLLFLIVSTSIYALPTAKFTIKVVDENNLPVEGANVGVGYYSPKKFGWGSTSAGDKGLTDADGIFISKGETEQLVSYGARKEGYYSSRYKFDKFTGVEGIIGFRKWQPWNPVLTIKLKKKINPVSLYATRTLPLIEWPKTTKKVAYDLIERDWVIPYGKGVARDFIFTLEQERANSGDDYKVIFKVDFSNSGDGIISVYQDKNSGSALRLDHLAPDNGYSSGLVLSYEKLPDKFYRSGHGDERTDQNYYFRIRTKLNEEGNVVSAYYGKIHDGFNFSKIPRKGKNLLGFTYYLNPNENDRNLEFDPEKNLFKSLTSDQRVHKP